MIPLQAATIAKPATASGLVAWWAFDDGTGTVAGDSSGNFTNGTLTGSPVWTSGKRAGALQFSGSNYITAGSIPQISGASDWTVSFWMNSTSVSNYRNPFDASFLAAGNNAGPRFEQYSNNAFTPNGNFGMVVGVDLATYSILDLQTTIVPGRWYHVTASRTGNTVQAYIDGVRVVNQANTNWPASFSAVNIGRGFSTSAERAFQGKIDDVRIYNRALTTAEVTALYRAGQVARKVANNTGLVGYWSFNEGSGLRAGDSSGLGDDGSLNGGPVWTTGKKGGALLFDGIDDWVNEISPAVSGVSNAFTVSGWIYPDNQYSRFLTPSANGIDNSIGYDNNNRSLEVFITEIADVNNRTRYSSVGSVPHNQWTHWAVSINGNNIKIYINGVLDSEYNEVISIAPWGGGGIWYLGQRGNSAFWFKGRLDDLRIYNRVLTLEEVRTIYRSNETKANVSQNTKATDGLVGYWTFNGKDVTTTVADVIGSNSGYLYNAATSTMLSIGKVGQGIQHNGSSSYFKAGGQSVLGTANQAYSIALWANIDPTESSGNIVHVSLASDGTNWCLPMINLNAGKISAISWTGGPSRAADPATATTGDWHHIVHTWSAATGLTLFVDGIQVANTAQAVFSASGGSNYIFTGFSPAACTDDRGYFNGKTDELRVYNKALSAAEVKQLYLMGK